MEVYPVEVTARAIRREKFDGVWKLGVFFPSDKIVDQIVSILPSKYYKDLSQEQKRELCEKGVRAEGDLLEFESCPLLDQPRATIKGKPQPIVFSPPPKSRFD